MLLTVIVNVNKTISACPYSQSKLVKRAFKEEVKGLRKHKVA